MTDVSAAAPTPIRVVIVDDHTMVAESFQRLLDAQPDIEVVGLASGLQEAISAATRHRPDVILMDYALPDGDGAAATLAVRAVLPSTKVLLLTGSDGSMALPAALEAGCVGYIEKTAAVDTLVQAVRAAAAGEVVLSHRDLGRLMGPRPERGPEVLTPREREVLTLVAEGLPNRTIAERLTLSLNTVRTHVQAVLTKLGAHSKLEAVAIARRRGLISDT
jgi:DNA-binding NarL/FixJ family response regulator